MAVKKGSDVRVYVGAYDLSTMATTAGIGLENPALDKTVFVDAAESVTPDVRRDTFNVAGFFDDAARGVDVLIGTLIGTRGDVASFLVGTATGDRCYSGIILVSAAQVVGRMGELVRAEVNVRSDGSFRPLKHFGPMLTATATALLSTGTVYDVGSGLNTGTVYFVSHVAQYTGTVGTLTFTFRRSVDGTTWSTLPAHTYTAIGSTLTNTLGVDVLGASDRYLRVDVSPSTLTCTFTVAAAVGVKL